jgi:hypothetical protein
VVVALTTGISGPAAAQRLAERPWWERSWESTSEHYWIKTDLPRDEARTIARHLDRMYEEFSRRLASLPARAPVGLNVYVFSNQRDYELTLRARFGVNAAGSGGMFFVTGPHHGLALWTEGLSDGRLRHVLQHEGFHQFAWSRFGGDLPNWVNEGLAEFFGLSVLAGDALIVGQAHQRTLDRLKDVVEREAYLSFEDVVGMPNELWMRRVNDGEATLLYEQAWSMVHFLVYGDGGRYTAAFERYLRLINGGLPSAEAFRRAFDTTETQAFEERWKQFIIAAQPSAFVTALERIEFLAEGALELAKRGIYPESLDGLKAELAAIDFSHEFFGHSRLVTLKAADDENYRIPLDLRSPEPPIFEVQRPDFRRMLLRERKLEQEHPSPSIIVTRHVEPRELSIEWRRNRDDPASFTYQIRAQ